LQHEIDHLDGTLYIDRMHTRTFTSARNLSQLLEATERLPESQGG
jgi:peptide deformylase